MRVIDARSGRTVAVGDTVLFGDSESVTLLAVRAWPFASARVRSRYRDHEGEEQGLPPGLKTTESWVPLEVRWTYPGHFLRRVGILAT